MSVAFRKSRRAQSKDDFETWVEDGAANTLNLFDVGDARTTHLVIEGLAPLPAGTAVPDYPPIPSAPVRLRVGSLFSGAGGADIGLHAAGHTTRWFCEVDPWRRQVLEAHWPGRPIYPDVKEMCLDRSNLPAPVDVIVGGFPCQDLSKSSARRAGLAGKRSGLFWEFHRIIDTLEPRWVVLENVPGLLSIHGGRDFAVLLDALVEIGYGVAWRVLDSRSFGVPQRRRRVFVVAARGDLGGHRAGQVLLEPEGSGWDPAARLQTASDLAARTRGRAARHGGTPDALPVTEATSTLKTDCGRRMDMEAVDGRQFMVLPRPPAAPDRVRRLTPREAERLQGWPDDHTAPPGLKVSDTRRYAAIGDGITAPVAEWLGRRLAEVHREWVPPTRAASFLTHRDPGDEQEAVA